jgi:hypothetical protein
LIEFSFLLPTRGRPQLLRRFLDSLAATTERLDDIEVVLGIDDDDEVSRTFTHDSVRLKKVVVPPGLNMGVLNQSCFNQSTGRFVFVMNDDVVSCTKGWDTQVRNVLTRFPDEIALVHVNDDLFGTKLCSFPIVSRRASLEIGFCPPEYRRYKIDDHIYEIYTLLARFGHRRIVFLKDVLFRHDNFEVEAATVKAGVNFASNGKLYLPDLEVNATDSSEFERQIEVRKSAACKLAGMIEEASLGRSRRSMPPVRTEPWLSSGDQGRMLHQLRAQENVLAEVHDPYTYRQSLLSVYPPTRNSAAARHVSVVLLANDLDAAHARRSWRSIKEHTPDSEIVVIDGNRQVTFCLVQAAGRLLAESDADILVLIEAGIVVEPSWIDRLLDAMDETTAIVAPVYLDAAGAVSSSGLHVEADTTAWPRDLVDMPTAPRACRAVRRGLLLIDLAKLHPIAIDPTYRHDFFDIELCLDAWERGFRVICTPHLAVRRLVLPRHHDPIGARLLFDADQVAFSATWIGSERIARIAAAKWSCDPFLAASPSMAGRDRRVRGGRRARLGRVMNFVRSNPRFLRMAMRVSTLRRRLLRWHRYSPSVIRRALDPLVEYLDRIYVVAAGARGINEIGTYRGHRIVSFDGVFCAIPPSACDLQIGAALLGDPSVHVATTMEAVRAKLDGAATNTSARK